MKSSLLYLSFLALPLLFSCGQSGNKNEASKDGLNASTDTIGSKQCFMAVDQQDTAALTLNSFKDGKITGDLVFDYLDKGKNDGTVSGAYRGDTLFVDYTFKIGTVNKTIYKNPLAFLKKDGNLILGVGQIETSLGRSYFVKGKPISFDKGRFTFKPVACKDSI
jgi:hypothetical protein